MTEFNFQATEEVAQKEYNLGKGQYFKPQNGDNKVRLVSACLPHDGEYQGKPTFKWLCQVLDRKDGVIKPYFMPHKVYEQIRDYQLDPEYAFSSVPMPYDINIKTTDAGVMTAKYQVIPARTSTPLTTEEQNLITEAPSVKELQVKIREADDKKEETPAKQPGNQEETVVNYDDIPF
jgi:hypothetical protein